MPRFVEEGIWENGYTDRHLDLVKSIQPGDRIAIKSSYTRKRDRPFDNRGQTVSVMAIKAIGTVTANMGDGRRVKVDWTRLESPREWYFYTNRSTIWRVVPGEWMPDALIAFAFEGKAQDYERFRNAPYHGIYYWVPNVLKHFDTEAINALIAPRPHLELTGDQDAGAPVDGVAVLEEKLAKVYALYGKPEHFRSVVYRNTGHEYLPEMVAWLTRHLPVGKSP